MLDENFNLEPEKTQPVNSMERLTEWIRKNLIHVLIVGGVAILLVVVLTNIHGCEVIKVSVPGEWIEDYYNHPSTSSGSSSYSFFSNMVRHLTQIPFIEYKLDELSSEDYDNERNDYLYQGSNLVFGEYLKSFLPNYQRRVARISFKLPNTHSGEEYRAWFNQAVQDMGSFGIKSYARLDLASIDASSDTLAIDFNTELIVFIESELLLNLYIPLNTQGQEPYYAINTKQSSSRSKRILLDLLNGGNNFNYPVRFQSEISSGRRDVETNRADLGFYLKYKDEKPKAGFVERPLNIGKVYMIWSPNINRRELLWLHQRYVVPCIVDFKKDNPVIEQNYSWLPSGYPYKAPEVVAQLEALEAEKAGLGTEPRNAKTYRIYYDHADMREFVDMIVARSGGKARFQKGQVLPPNQFLEDSAKMTTPAIYIYGVSLHSMYNLPTEVISRSFWYQAGNTGLWSETRELIEEFGTRISVRGEPDPQEYLQYADIERALCIGESNSRSGWQPLFTVPYAMIYDSRDLSGISFNSTRGFLSLIKKIQGGGR